MTQTAVSLTTNLEHQFQEAAELRNLAYAIIVAEHKRKFTRAQHLGLLIFYRNLQTHEATEILLKQKLVEDARVLLRVLVEHSVNCAYMLMVTAAYDSTSLDRKEPVAMLDGFNVTATTVQALSARVAEAR